MAGVAVNPLGVTTAGIRVVAAGLESLTPAVGPVSPAAPDPVSVGAAETLSARVAALLAHGGAAAVIKEHHAGLRRLGNWYHDHADHAKAAAATADAQADNFCQAKAAIPTPKQFQRVDYALANARMLAATKPMYVPVVTQLETERAELETQATSHYANYHAAATGSSLTGAPLDPPPRPHNDTQMLGGPYGPAPREPAPPPPPGDPVEPTGGDGGAGAVERHPQYPEHRPNGEWAPGNSGMDGDAAAQHTFDDMEAAGIPVVRQEVPVRITDPQTGQTYTRRYDALVPTGVPGQYIGIEHKVNASPITDNQRTVDNLVRGGSPARGTLNGQPIDVVDVRVIRVEWPPPALVPVPAEGSPGALLPSTEGGAPVLPGWGTYVPPEEAAKAGGELGNLGKVLESFLPHDPHDPRNMA